MKKAKKIVTVGGGTGSYTVLTGLKNLKNVSLTALVSMADDGGSSGKLRRELGVSPPGDVRQCLAALTEHGKNVRKLINYRFEEGTLTGHTFGNIMLASLERITKDFSAGVKIASEILKIKGQVIPITEDEATLRISFLDGESIVGEGNIDIASFSSEVKEISYTGNVKISPRANDAILKADYIIIGPGNFYCSVLPNLIVKGLKDSIKKSKAKVIFVLNLVNKQGHTTGWGKSKYVKIVERYLGKKINFILDNNEKFSTEQRENYLSDAGSGEIFIKDDLNDRRLIKADLLSDVPFQKDKADVVERSLIRHDSKKLAKVIEKIISKNQ